MHVTTETLVAALRSSGLRLTRPRREVCAVVAAHHAGHLTAAAIAGLLEGRVDQSTVYRTLETLEEVGVLTHTHLGHGASVYHLAEDEPHQHLVCVRCGRAEAVDVSVLRPGLDELARRTGFSIDLSHFALSGVCADCRRAGHE